MCAGCNTCGHATCVGITKTAVKYYLYFPTFGLGGFMLTSLFTFLLIWIRLIFKTSSVTPEFFHVFNLILSFSTCSQSFKKICTWGLWGANVLKLAYEFFSPILAQYFKELRLDTKSCNFFSFNIRAFNGRSMHMKTLHKSEDIVYTCISQLFAFPHNLWYLDNNENS